MAYFIFLKDLNNIYGTISRIAENEYDLNNLNIEKTDYKIIEDSQSNFDLVKYGTKYPSKYTNNTIVFEDTTSIFNTKKELQDYIFFYKQQIKQFLNNNQNNKAYDLWNNYYNQLSNLNLNNITYPLNISLEQYLKNQGQTSLNPLQLP